MILVWKGWGPLGLVALFLPLASISALPEWNPQITGLAAGASLAGGGWVCRHLGRKWNRGAVNHSMYGVPLEVWGWLYLWAGLLFCGACVVVLVKKSLTG